MRETGTGSTHEHQGHGGRRRVRHLLGIALSGILLSAASARGGAIEAGRVFERDRPNRLFLTLGQVTSIEGSVEENTRRLFTIAGQDAQLDNAESYSFDELGLDSSDLTFGLSYERMWKWITLRADGTYVRAEASGRAPRDLYIGVSDVSFGGQTLDYIVIPEGTFYDATIESLIFGMRGQVTPFTVNSRGAVQFVPWLNFGFYSWAGSFDVDAGVASGIIPYENPPRNYVVRGKGSGSSAIFAPEVGLGGELRFRLSGPPEAGLNLVLQANYNIFQFKGTTDDLAISSRDAADITVDYQAFDMRGLLEIPMTQGTDLLLGIEFRRVTAEGSAEAQDISLDETLVRGAKFDKDISFETTTVNALFGIRF